MEELFRNCQNPGLRRRFNLEEAMHFADFSDEDIRKVLKSLVVSSGLSAAPSTLDFAIKLISQRRRLDDFGNAGEASALLDRAKMKLSARKALVYPVTLDQPNLLLEEDFVGQETSADKARDAFGDLENIEHILSLISELENTMETAKAEGRDPAQLVEDAHMIFTGPPGTGKTTAAQRFGQMFKNLELLPRADVVVVQASTLLDRYVGGTANNVLDAMRRAKGGILFIDEAYGLVPRHASYGGEALKALLDNITSPEFKGKLIIILGGYYEHIEELFTANAGLRSRFDKVRVDFPKWTAKMATDATLKFIAKNSMSISDEGKVSFACLCFALLS